MKTNVQIALSKWMHGQRFSHYHYDDCENETEEFYESEGEYFCKDSYIENTLENAERITAEELDRGG